MPALLLLLAANPDNNTTNHSPLNSPITSAISPPQTLSPQTATPQPSTDTQQQLPVLAATQRVQQKAAIAIGRLVVYNDTMCAALVSGGGLERLVELAVCRGARLDSDYTLVSVVTAVRKIAGVAFPAARNIVPALSLTAFTTIWTGAIALMIHGFAANSTSGTRAEEALAMVRGARERGVDVPGL